MSDGLVGEGTAAGNDAHATGHVDVAGHDTDLAPRARIYHAGAVGSDEADRVGFDVAVQAHHVVDGDPLGDARDQRYSGVDRFSDGVRGERRGHEDQRDVGLGGVHRLAHRIENRHGVIEHLPTTARCHAGDELGAVLPAGPGVETALAPRDPLDQHPGLLVKKDAHETMRSPACWTAPP